VLDRAFPQNNRLLVTVVDGQSADIAEDAAEVLAARLRARPDLFRNVRRPDGLEFFRRNGLLFLSVAEVEATADEIIAVQPLIGTLAADPSMRGLFDSLSLALEGVARGDTKMDKLVRPLSSIATTVEETLAGKNLPLSWQNLMTGRTPKPAELRRFVLAQPSLNFRQLASGAQAIGFVRNTANELGLTPDNGVRVRLTGTVAIADEEFATIAEGAEVITILSFVLVVLILFGALSSFRMIAAIVVTLIVGLITTAAFAALAIGSLNPISVAFGALFLGIAVDFGIQFSVRFREERHREADAVIAMRRCAGFIVGPLSLAALVTAVGFLAFVPTDYSGVSELGLIAGGGMIIALVLNMTLLPALLALFKPGGESAAVGYAWAAPIDDFLLRRRRLVLGFAAAIAVAGLASVPWLRFDFNPLNLRNQSTESVSTFIDLTANPDTTPYTAETLAPSSADSARLAAALKALPQVARVVTIASFVPENQGEKIEIIDDAASIFGPTLDDPFVKDPPTAAETRQSLSDAAGKLKTVGASPEGDPMALRLAAALDKTLAADAPTFARVESAITKGLKPRLDSLRLAMHPQEVTLDTLPDELKRDWVTADGRVRVQAYPRGDARDNAVLVAFAEAVKRVMPDAVGAAITIPESGQTVVDAFVRAGVAALIAIALLLAAVLRRARDVALVMAPLLFAALLTELTCVAIGMPINFANIIALPMLLGVGVAFMIYYVVNWRRGIPHPLSSSLTRAVLFSALTTAAAFGTLAISSHPGTAAMGELLAIALFNTLIATFIVLPALMGPPPQAERPA
jgi:hopanoid biosynthesis associated RND transporter like protein HpnN